MAKLTRPRPSADVTNARAPALYRELVDAVIGHKYVRMNRLASGAGIRNLRAYLEQLALHGKIDDSELALALAGVEWRRTVTKRIVIPALYLAAIAAVVLEWRARGAWGVVALGGGVIAGLGYLASVRTRARTPGPHRKRHGPQAKGDG